ncbi:hypothetical protein [Halomarina litorea]|uniref:hypothetical protein n=1 Tax=Halomarina litorea TaxID=2961595 RepID=UPI0020C5194D|nr:hypothetical protein [Halomarina sp. BCD28]
MNEAPLELVVEVLSVVAYAAGAVLLTGLGVLTERAGVEALASDTTLGLWMLGMGAVALAGAYLVATGRLLPRVRALTAGE